MAVGGGWWLVSGGGWRLAVVGGWRLAVGHRWLLAAIGDWRLAAVGGWQLVAVGGWWSLGVVLKGDPQQHTHTHTHTSLPTMHLSGTVNWSICSCASKSHCRNFLNPSVVSCCTSDCSCMALVSSRAVRDCAEPYHVRRLTCGNGSGGLKGA